MGPWREWAVRRLLIAWVMFSAVVACAGALYWLYLAATGELVKTDFVAFYATSHLLLTQGTGAVYDLSAQHRAQLEVRGSTSALLLPDPYPPFWVLFRFWLAVMPLRTAYLAWGVLSVAAGAAAFLVLAAPPAPAGSRPWRALLTAGFPPVVVTVLQGQPVTFVMLGIALSLWFWTRGREAAAGAALALVLIKPQLALLLLALPLLWRSLRATAGLAGAAALLAAISLAAFGTAGIRAWAALLTADQGQLLRPWLSLRAPLVAMGLHAPEQYGILALGGLALLSLIRWRRLDLRHGFAAATAGSLLISPHVNYHDLALLAVPGLLIGGNRARTAAAAGYCGAALALVLAPAAWLAGLAAVGGAMAGPRQRGPE